MSNLFFLFLLLYGNLLQICIAGSGYALKKLLDPDPHSEEQLDPDLKKMNSDPQLCSHHSVCKVTRFKELVREMVYV